VRPRTRGAIQPTQERTALALRPDGALRLVVVADTHGQPHPDAARLIAAERPDAILHAGDIGDLAVLDALAAIAPVTAVRGNIDARATGPSIGPDGAQTARWGTLPDVLTIDVRDGDRTLLVLLLLHIALYGPKLRADAARTARAAGASLVVCGHSHVPFLGRDQGIAIVNPGSIGPRRFHLPIVFAVVEISRERVAMHHVSCETGARWEP
jgi:hypothetical protein